MIEASDVPLSHLDERQTGALNPRKNRNFLWTIILTVIVFLGGLIIWEPEPSSGTERVLAKGTAAKNPVNPENTKQDIAPFERLSQEKAKEDAMEQIAFYIQLESQIDQDLIIGEWGVSSLRSAKEMATKGDQHYYFQDFDQALDHYRKAKTELTDLSKKAESKFREYLTKAQKEVVNLNPLIAKTSIQDALSIKPNSEEAKELSSRIDQLPEIIDLLRSAKNHQLQGRLKDSLTTYQLVYQKDPLTTDLGLFLDEIHRNIKSEEIKKKLTEGFSLLQEEDFESARESFSEVLSLDNNNEIASSGLEQIAINKDLSIIEEKRLLAVKAMANDKWQEAIGAFQEILKMDPNIQFAAEGRAQAESQERSERLLSNIVSAPYKLSSEKLFLDAKIIVQDSAFLEFQNSALINLIQQVSDLLEIYATPIDVTLISDNATEVIVSNIGKLGRFNKKIITVRPGRYTIRGSQVGCKDTYQSIDILPGTSPISVNCEERIN